MSSDTKWIIGAIVAMTVVVISAMVIMVGV